MSHYISTKHLKSNCSMYANYVFRASALFSWLFLWVSAWLMPSLLHHLGQPTQPWLCQSSSGGAARPRQKLCLSVAVRTFSKLSGCRDREFSLVFSPASPSNSDPPSCEIGLSNKSIILHIITRSNPSFQTLSTSSVGVTPNISIINRWCLLT